MALKIKSILAIGASLVTLGSMAAAEPVKLRSHNGTTSFSGVLIRYDSQKFVIKTSLGEINVKRNSVTCIGKKCPSATQNDFLTMHVVGSNG